MRKPSLSTMQKLLINCLKKCIKKELKGTRRMITIVSINKPIKIIKRTKEKLWISKSE